MIKAVLIIWYSMYSSSVVPLPDMDTCQAIAKIVHKEDYRHAECYPVETTR